MTSDERVDSLKSKHATLERAIHEETQRPHPDDFRLTELKREKLRVKDEIAFHDEH